MAIGATGTLGEALEYFDRRTIILLKVGVLPEETEDELANRIQAAPAPLQGIGGYICNEVEIDDKFRDELVRETPELHNLTPGTYLPIIICNGRKLVRRLVEMTIDRMNLPNSNEAKSLFLYFDGDVGEQLGLELGLGFAMSYVFYLLIYAWCEFRDQEPNRVHISVVDHVDLKPYSFFHADPYFMEQVVKLGILDQLEFAAIRTFFHYHGVEPQLPPSLQKEH